MCLFCSSFAIAGEIDELWRLFSYQAFAASQLQYLDLLEGQSGSQSERTRRYRELYRRAIPFIDEFTEAAFGRKLVAAARKKTREQMHPFWRSQLERERGGQERSS
ncbi:hypothetical protein D3C87_1643340 [compost metagenome]